MRILLSYASEYDKGEGVHFERVLRRIGHEVIPVNVAVRGKPGEIPAKTVIGFCPGEPLASVLEQVGGADLFLYVEPLGLVPRGLESSPIPTACVLSDVHRHLKPRQILARLFDHVFLYQREYRQSFTDHPPGAVHWFPWSCDVEVVRDLKVPRDLDIAFIGQLFNDRSIRRHVIGILSKRYRMNEQRYYLQREIPQAYSHAKIVVNIPLGGDLNSRFFEALSCGALLITERARNGQEELFREGVHYVAFDEEGELYEKVEYYLQHDEERARIALAGHEEVLRRHTLSLRLEGLLDAVRFGPERSAPVRALRREAMVDIYAYVYEWGKQVEALLAIAAENRGNPAVRFRVVAKALRTFLARVLHDA